MTATPIADMIAEMLKNCIPLETIILAVRSMERAVSTRQGVDETAENRRTWDREYRRKRRANPPDPPDNHPKTPDVGNVALSSLEDKKSYPIAVKKEKKERGGKIPPDWKPNQKHYDEGVKLGMDRHAVDDRGQRMREWCAANSNRSITTKANWDAAFMGAWLRDSRNGQSTFANRTATSSPQQSGSAAIIAGVAAATERRARERNAAGQPGPIQRNVRPATGDDPQLFGETDRREPH